jgi:hypothetical protein
MAQPASFRRVRFGFNALLLLGAASSAVLLMGGCDTESGKKDKEVSQALDSATIKMTGSATDRQTANATLTSAVRETTDSPPQQLRAKTLLADSELQMAQDLVAQILANDAQIDRLTREIGLLSNQIQSNNMLVAALVKHEPSKVQDAVTQNKATVTGSDSKPDWYKSDTSTISSMSADDAQVKDLTGKISDLQNTIKTESDQRNQLLDQADKLTQQSQHEVKQKSVDLFVQGSNARKQAADLTVKLDTDTAALARYQADLAAWQGQHDSAATAIKTFDDKSTAFAADWKTVQDMQATLNEASKEIMGDEPVPSNVPVPDKNGDLNLKGDQTIGTRAAAIGDKEKGLARKNHDLRSQAEAHFNNAIGKYGEAATIARTIRQTLTDLENKADPGKPDREPWNQEKAALDPATYQLLQAEADLQKAEFFARSAAEAKVRLDLMDRVKPVLTEAKLTIIPTLDDDDSAIADQLKKSQASARESFKDAADLLTSISSQVPELQKGAELQLIFAQYGWAILETAAGDAQAASIHMGLAKTAFGAAVSDGIALPPLPTELAGSPPSAAGTVPGGAPGTLRTPR